MKPVVIGIDIGGMKVVGWLIDGTLWGTDAITRDTPAACHPGALDGLTVGEGACTDYHPAAIAQSGGMIGAGVLAAHKVGLL